MNKISNSSFEAAISASLCNATGVPIPTMNTYEPHIAVALLPLSCIAPVSILRQLGSTHVNAGATALASLLHFSTFFQYDGMTTGAVITTKKICWLL